MSDSKMKLSLVLEGKDKSASSALKNLKSGIKDATATASAEAKKAGTEQLRVIRTIDRESRQAAGARSRLGMRSEQEIQREISRTRQAYQTLVNSGKASQRELQRAARMTRDRVRELNAEMGKTTKLANLSKWGKAAGTMAAGVYGAVRTLKEPIQQRRDFDLNLAYAANTAYSDRDVKGRIAGKQDLYNTVKQTVSSNGGSRDQALEALNAMIASGVVEIDVAKKLLPVIQRTSVASGTDSGEIAQIAISAMQQYQIKPEEVKLALDKAMAAGQAGQFELTDMAKWLPKAMAATANGGMNGLKDFDILLRALQQSRITAGGADEGGNNFVNLAAKITSSDAVNRFARAEYVDKNGKRHRGINLAQSLLKHKEQGENTLDAFMHIVDEYMTSNKQYQQLQAKINAATNDTEKKQLLEQQASILGGTAVGELVADRQALMALLAIKNNKSFGDDVMKELQNAKGTIDTAHAVIQDTTYAKQQNFNNTKEFGAMESLRGLDGTLGDVNQKLADYGNQYPTLGKMIGGTSVAFNALTTAAMAAAGALGLLSLGSLGKGKAGGGGKIGGKGGRFGGLFKGKNTEVKAGAGRVAGANAGKLATNTEKVARNAATLGKYTDKVSKVVKGAGVAAKGAGQVAGRLGAPVTVALAGYEGYQIINDKSLNRDEKLAAGVRLGGSTSGTLAGMGAGAAIGSAIPIIGTLVGSIIGGFLGNYMGGWAGNKVAENIGETRPAQINFSGESRRLSQFVGTAPSDDMPNSRFIMPTMSASAAVDGVQPAITQQTTEFQSAMQANSAQLGALLENINSTLASQQQIIHNEISLSVDGRVIAEQVAERQLQMYNRG